MIAHSSFCNESVVISYGIVAARGRIDDLGGKQ